MYIDKNVTVPIKKTTALESLRKNKIAISDTIVSCRMKRKCPLDTDLYDVEYNVEMIQ